MENRRNYYRILHIQHDAPEALIRASYRTLMRTLKCHPDLGGDHWNAVLLNEAFAVLSDPEKRAAYDRRHGYTRTAPAAAKEACEEKSDLKTSGDSQEHHFKPAAEIICPFCQTGHSINRQDLRYTNCTQCQSPLQPAAHLKLETDGRRAINRTRHNGPMTYFTKWPQRIGHTGIITDLSLNGMHFLARSPIRAGRVIKIVNSDLCAVARVVSVARTHPMGAYSAGVMFLTLRFFKSHGVFVSENI